jgi:hypothetical protein
MVKLETKGVWRLASPGFERDLQLRNLVRIYVTVHNVLCLMSDVIYLLHELFLSLDKLSVKVVTSKVL